jgi:hypothetical protein
VSWNQSSLKKSPPLPRHARESGHPDVFEIPGFRLALAVASLAGMTSELFNGFREHHTSNWGQYAHGLSVRLWPLS